MDTGLFALRNVKYKPLRHLFNRKLIVSTFDQIEKNVLTAVGPDVPAGFRLKSSLKNLEIMLAKYGFLDLDFVTPRDLLTSRDRITREGIRELGYSSRPASLASDIAPAGKKQLNNDRACLETLTESIKENTTYLSLFLNSNYSPDAMSRQFEEVKLQFANGLSGEEALTSAIFVAAEKMKRSFPITFTIEDACLANSDTIWLAKHVYL